MKADFESLKIELAALYGDRVFQNLIRMDKSISVLDLINLKETSICTILAWLLNPKEGHGQNDYFIKRLLQSAHNSLSPEKLKSFPDRTLANLRSYGSAIVVTEVQIDNKRRIDIILLDTINKILILIERKDGSKAHTNQLHGYLSWAESNFEGYEIYPLLVDSYSNDHGDQKPNGFVQLDDAWLADSLSDLIGKNILSQRMEIIFTELHDFVFGEFSDDRDPYYKGRDDLYKQFAKKHSSLINKLRNSEIRHGGKKIKITSITHQYYIVNLLKAELSIDELYCCDFIVRNHRLIEDIIQYDEFEILEDTVKKYFSGLVSVIHKDGISFILEAHRPKLDNDQWPYWIYLEKISDNNSHDTLKYLLRVTVSKNCPESHLTIMEDALRAFDLKPRNNWKYCRRIIDENLSEIQLEPGTKFFKDFKLLYDKAISINK